MDESKIVITDSGKIRGYRKDGVLTFWGIPYASPPVGQNRFAPPQPVQPWHDVFDAARFGPVAPQLPGAIPVFPREQSEANCLTLNIWTPDVDDKKRPVLFWIHGGSFIAFSGPVNTYRQKLTARGDVVVVSINYRLGVLGFLYVGGKTANVGLQDQVEALKWVNRNIAQFGGDPTNITIFGESAGGGSIGIFLGMPSTRGLFKRAIMQSAGFWAPPVGKPENGEALSKQVFDILGIPYGDLDSLRGVAIDKLLPAWQKALEGMTFNPNAPPYIDGEVVSLYPMEAIKRGLDKNFEIMAGTNENEMSIFISTPQAMPAPPGVSPNLDNMDAREFQLRISYVLRMLGINEQSSDNIVETYINESKQPPFNGLKYAWEKFFTDLFTRINILRHLDEIANRKSKVYSYMFSWKTPEMGGKLGAPHMLELPFVFGNLGNKSNFIFPARTAETEKLSFAMMDAWINFARCGNPNHAGIPEWPEYNAQTRPTMVFDVVTRAETNLFEARTKVWDGIF